MILEKELEEIFSITFAREDPSYFGFSRSARIYHDKEHVKIIGFLADFKLPDTSVEVIIGQTYESELNGKNEKIIAYVLKEEPNLEFTLPIVAKEDDLIRSILKNPKTYAVEDVFTEMKKHREKGVKVLASCPVVYVGEKYVIACAPTVELSKLEND